MPLSIGVSRWSDLEETALAAIQAHAAYKSMDAIDWQAWLRIDRRSSSGFDIPYSVGDVVFDLLEDYCGDRRLGTPYFVPYNFNYNLLPGYPAPREFWFDQLHPQEWKGSPVVVIEAIWFHTVWRGTMDDAYRQQAEEGARRFNQEYQQLKDGGTEDFIKLYPLAYNYVEIGLIQCLEEGLDHNLPVLLYP